MRKTLVIIIALIAVAGGGLWLARRAGQQGEPHRPHIVLIIIDTLRADRMGCYGFERDTSPELDQLSRLGVRFERAVAQSPWTRPSIGSFLTSIYPRTLGIHFEKEGILADREVTLSEVLKANGYRTLGATANPHLNPSYNFHQGFDHYLDSINVFHWMPDWFDQVPSGHPPLPPATELFAKTLAFMDHENETDRSRPHYLQFNLMEVHENWGENDLVRPEFKQHFTDIDYMKERRYLQALRQLSTDIDAFLTELGSRPGWEDMLVVIVSDHGEGLGSHPSVVKGDTHGYLLYESQLVVPWFLYSTTGLVPRETVVERPVRLIDLMPTLLDLLDIPAPPRVVGTSLVPLFDGGEVELPAGFVAETHFRNTFKLGVYTDDWNLVQNRDKHRGLDPVCLNRPGTAENGPRTNLAAQHGEVVGELSAYIASWEERHPASPPVELDGELPADMLRQLRSLGYIE
jgi:arylsulfatase A-like enzyme